MKIKYVGLKDFEDAFRSETGLTWGPGVEHEIEDPAMVARMLRHPDVWAVSESKAKKAPAPAPEGKTDDKSDDNGGEGGNQAKFLMQTEEGELVLDDLDKDTLRKLAKELEIKIHHTKSEDHFREELAKAFPVTGS